MRSRHGANATKSRLRAHTRLAVDARANTVTATLMSSVYYISSGTIVVVRAPNANLSTCLSVTGGFKSLKQYLLRSQVKNHWLRVCFYFRKCSTWEQPTVSFGYLVI